MPCNKPNCCKQHQDSAFNVPTELYTAASEELKKKIEEELRKDAEEVSMAKLLDEHA